MSDGRIEHNILVRAISARSGVVQPIAFAGDANASIQKAQNFYTFFNCFCTIQTSGDEEAEYHVVIELEEDHSGPKPKSSKSKRLRWKIRGWLNTTRRRATATFLGIMLLNGIILLIVLPILHS
ncbi:hypothetical protein BDZ45DRAFT_372503 [Acephala macrosclerotiorum]|nr:hypothetical protein BDZ45DRAFT_372503 [Acephala macrosclerotiorum]